MTLISRKQRIWERTIKNSNTEAGERWRSAENSERTVRIYVHNGGIDQTTGEPLVNEALPGSDNKNGFWDNLKSTLELGGNAWINFNPNDNLPLNGGGSPDAESTLAHEIGHACLMILGRNPWTRKYRELDGSAVENQYRGMVRNITQRPMYDTEPGYRWNLQQYDSANNTFSIYRTNRRYRIRK